MERGEGEMCRDGVYDGRSEGVDVGRKDLGRVDQGGVGGRGEGRWAGAVPVVGARVSRRGGRDVLERNIGENEGVDAVEEDIPPKEAKGPPPQEDEEGGEGRGVSPGEELGEGG